MTQAGRVKVNGRNSILQMSKLSKTKQLRVKRLFAQFARGDVTCRELAELLSKTLSLGRIMSHETARRVYHTQKTAQGL